VGNLGEGVDMVDKRIVVGIAVIGLAAGCASSDQEPVASTSPSASESSAAPVAGNGSVYAATWDADVSIARYPILSDGSIGEASALLTGPVDDTTFPGVVDGLGEAALTGTFDQYWTRNLAVRSATTGEAVSELDVDRWCGGEGLTYGICVLLDDVRLARTSELGGDASGAATVTVSSLQDGSTIDEFGPFPGLTMLLGTSDADTVILVTTTDEQGDTPENLPGVVWALDLATGTTTEIGPAPADWGPLCAIGTDSVLGFAVGAVPSAVVVGPAEVPAVEWSEDEAPIGCSADGQFLYLQHFPQPPGEENDTEPPNPPTTLDRITLADGSRDAVLDLDPGVAAGPITR
jgi:hypothetical protein